MSKERLVVFSVALILTLGVGPATAQPARPGQWSQPGTPMPGVGPATAQGSVPQWDPLLRLTWTAERLGPSRALILGVVRNLSEQPASQVILRAEGMDHDGKPVSRAPGFLPGEIPPRGSSPFEIRLALSGPEKQYRVVVEFFEFVGRVEGP
jgi:hypothetical protein